MDNKKKVRKQKGWAGYGGIDLFCQHLGAFRRVQDQPDLHETCLKTKYKQQKPKQPLPKSRSYYSFMKSHRQLMAAKRVRISPV